MRAFYIMGPQRKLSANISYQQGSFYDGTLRSIEINQGRVELSPRFSVEPSVTVNWVDLAEGSFTLKVVRTRASFTFTPRMFFSGLIQYNSNNASIGSNLRYRWEYRPGSELFVVYTDEHDTTRPRVLPGLKNRAFVVKINRLFRF
jgi:hypothetical protein